MRRFCANVGCDDSYYYYALGLGEGYAEGAGRAHAIGAGGAKSSSARDQMIEPDSQCL